MSKKKLSDADLQNNKAERMMNAVLKYAAYYRENIHRFVEEYLGIELKLFQKILLYAMDKNDICYYIASRGQGKSFLVALYAVSRCILYPHTQCIVCSYTYKQGKIVIEKITNDFMHRSPLLVAEISKVTTGQNDCFIYFKNGSWIKVVVAGEGARGNRSNLLIVDEARLVPEKTLSEILRPMNSASRYAGYLNKPEYYHLQEVNREIYMSSAYYASSEMFEKVKSYFSSMLTPGLKFFVTALPYQLSIKEGLLMREQIQNEMSESTFSDITFMMEREALFYGSSENALFDFKILNDRRVLSDSIHYLEYYKDHNIKIPTKQDGEIRIISLDIALLASKRHQNDASCFIIHCGIPTPSHNYIDNFSYVETQEGLTTDELGLLTMRYYYQYEADYLVIDGAGIGQAILDYCMTDRYDPLYNETYHGLNVMNAPDLEERCKSKDAPKVIYVIKANSRFNNDAILSLRSGFQNSYINLLISDTEADKVLSRIKGWTKLSDSEQAKLKLPYVQTSFLIDELINLDHDVSNGLIKIKERSGRRKDRVSSAEYGYTLIQELSKDLKPNDSPDWLDMLTIHRAKYRGKKI